MYNTFYFLCKKLLCLVSPLNFSKATSPHLSHLYVSIVFILITFFYDFKYDEKNVILIN